MAIYHFSMKIIKRSAGRSATAAAAYRGALTIVDERTGEMHKYENRGGVLTHDILTPSRAPDWAKDAESLWNEVERKENRKNSQLARENVVALPHELTLEQNRELLHAFVQDAYVKRGMAAQVNIHGPAQDEQADERNIHAHVLLTMRGITRNGWKDNKARVWNEKDTLQEWREMWANHVNLALERAGISERVTEKSFEDLGLDKVPTRHLGPAANEMERRGEQSRIAEENREAKRQNEKMAELEFKRRVMDEAIVKEAKRLAEEKAKALEREREERERRSREYSEQKRSILAAAFVAFSENSRAAAQRDLLNRGPEFWAQVDKEFAQEEREIKASYNIAELAGQYADARQRAAGLDTANGRFSGAYERAMEEARVIEENIKNAKWRQQEALERLETEREVIRAARAEREEVMNAKLNAQYEALRERQGGQSFASAHEQDNAPGVSVDSFEEGEEQEQGHSQDDGMDLSR